MINVIKSKAAAFASEARDCYRIKAKRNAAIKNAVVIAGALTIGMLISPAKAIGVLVTKMPCLDHDNCIVTTIQEFDI